MTFTTLTFFAFASLVVTLYWLLRDWRRQNLLLVAASYAFYGWWDARFCGLLALSSLVDYLVARRLGSTSSPARRKLLLGASVACNLGLLGTFKYYGFFVSSLGAAAQAVGLQLELHTLHVVLPVGISFYTFQTLGATIDVYRRRVEPCRDPVTYFAFVSFFPQLVAGPIERAGHLLPQFSGPRRFDVARAREGLRLVLWGMVLKVALADNLATVVELGYAPGAAGPLVAISTVAFAFQIYWDFAGYSSIAIGTAALMGITLQRNFALPYFSRSMPELWRRWHISLSTWFRDYVYVPLGGKRLPPRRRAAAVLLTFVVSGLWHGAAWTFVAWGAFHGLLVAAAVLRGRPGRSVHEVAGGEGSWPSARAAAQMLGTFALTCVGWVLFRAPDLATAWTLLGRMATELAVPAAWSSLSPHAEMLRALLPLLALGVMVEWLTRRQPHPLALAGWPRSLRWLLYTALLWGTLYLMRADPTRFIYFQF